jgi:hypothetical protein
MSLNVRNTWFRRLGLAAIAAVALGAATIPTAPADAALRVFAGHRGIHVAVVQHPHHDWWRWHQPWHHYGRY